MIAATNRAKQIKEDCRKERKELEMLKKEWNAAWDRIGSALAELAN